MGFRFLRVHQPEVTEADIEQVVAALRATELSGRSPRVKQFEGAFAARARRRFAVATSSGTAALHAALAALGVGPGDEVVVPTLTIMSPIFAVRQLGAVPVLVDAEPRSWGMAAAGVESRLSSKTRAIVIVHLYGRIAPAREVAHIAERRGIPVIEDCAEVLGSEEAGTSGAIACYSFFANKLVTTGEGGMITCDDAKLATEARSFCDLGFGTGADKFVHRRVGLNYRMSALQAALGSSQLTRLDVRLEQRRQLARNYDQALAAVARVERFACAGTEVCWMYTVLLAPSVDRSRLIALLAEKHGIETRPVFKCAHQQPVLQRDGLFSGEEYPVAEDLSARGLNLPSGFDIGEADVVRVTRALDAELNHQSTTR